MTISDSLGSDGTSWVSYWSELTVSDNPNILKYEEVSKFFTETG